MPESPPDQGPGLLKRAANYGKAVVRHVADGSKHVGDDVYLARLTICVDCPSFEPEQTRCKERSCGCRLTKKARWRSESCPLSKWPAPEGP